MESSGVEGEGGVIRVRREVRSRRSPRGTVTGDLVGLSR